MILLLLLTLILLLLLIILLLLSSKSISSLATAVPYTILIFSIVSVLLGV